MMLHQNLLPTVVITDSLMLTEANSGSKALCPLDEKQGEAKKNKKSIGELVTLAGGV